METEYISTETGCKYLRKYKIEDGTSFLYDEGFNDGIETAISCIGNEVPSADVRPVKRARWIESDDHGICSNCGTTEYSKNRKFCHNCGADMRHKKETTMNKKYYSHEDLVEALMGYTWRDEDERLLDDADEKRAWIEAWLYPL